MSDDENDPLSSIYDNPRANKYLRRVLSRVEKAKQRGIEKAAEIADQSDEEYELSRLKDLVGSKGTSAVLNKIHRIEKPKRESILQRMIDNLENQPPNENEEEKPPLSSDLTPILMQRGNNIRPSTNREDLAYGNIQYRKDRAKEAMLALAAKIKNKK